MTGRKAPGTQELSKLKVMLRYSKIELDNTLLSRAWHETAARRRGAVSGAAPSFLQ